MSEDSNVVIGQLRSLSDIDASLSRILAERKQRQDKIDSLKTKLEELQAESSKREAKWKDSKNAFAREDKEIKFEREKIGQRRKALATFVSFKSQQAAAKEIDISTRQLDKREEEVINLMVKSEELEKLYAETTGQIETASAELKELEETSTEFFGNLDERESEKKALKDTISSKVESSYLSVYTRIAGKYNMNPVVAVTNSVCTGCNVTLRPQVLVEISRANKLVPCPTCKRILFVEKVSEEADDA